MAYLTSYLPDSAVDEYLLLCSGCRTPTPAHDATVIPRWNPDAGTVWTSYRCAKCLPQALDELRALVADRAEVRASFCDFLDGRGYQKDVATIRAAAPELQTTYLTRVLDAVQDGRLILEP